MKTATAFLLVGISGACSVPHEHVPVHMPALEPFHPTDARWSASRPALLIADCQLHNLFSLPVAERNLTADVVTETDIRPPQLDLFSADVLRWILEQGSSEAEVIIHLGDAMNLACEGEALAFLEVMRTATKPWVMAPGNHDCYFFGNYSPPDPEGWDSACHAAGHRMSKDRFIRLYVAALLAQDQPEALALARALGVEDRRQGDLLELALLIPDRFEWSAPEDAAPFLRDIAWNIEVDTPWRSFLLQRVDLSGSGRERCHAILMDSCQYGERPTLAPNAWQAYPIELNAGYTGEMLADQLRLVRQWIEDDHDQRAVALMCHHPLSEIAPKSRAAIKWLWKRHHVPVVVTAHTHKGFYVHHDLGDEQEGLELNLASTTDWPMEWRVLTLYGNGHEEAYIEPKRYTMAKVIRHHDGFFEPQWEVPVGAPDDYRSYRDAPDSPGAVTDLFLMYHYWPPFLAHPSITPTEGAVELTQTVKNIALWSYGRLIESFATATDRETTHWPEGCRSDAEVMERIRQATTEHAPLADKIALMQELARFERTRTTRDATGASSDAARARFKISQAVWASRFERPNARTLSPEDDLIRIRTGIHRGETR
ncbi:MAG: metallophosphoesterase [Planctomycetes bacterium]|nr:metallophosphoesterase [Planctomycetota bacterium]